MDNIAEDVIKLLVSLVVGAIIGTEREYKTKAAGFRTVILITMGSTLFTMISGFMGGERDPARIASNIITGIGFIGAGAIFKEGTFVKGLTTAAVIWVSAAIGMAIGIGKYEFVVIALIIVMGVLLGFTWFQQIIDKTNVHRSYRITIIGNQMSKLDELNEMFASCKLSYRCSSQGKRSSEMILTYSVRGSEKHHNELIKLFYSSGLIDSFEV